MVRNEFDDLRSWGICDYANLCEAAYLPDMQAIARAESLGFNCRMIQARGASAIVCRDDDRFIVAVRGTQISDLRDIISDGRCCPDRYRGGLVHRGFSDHAGHLWTDLCDAGIITTRKQLIFCGHSLGGAAAIHLATRAGATRRSNLTRPHLLTIGAPRVGTRGFIQQVHHFTASTTRIVNHRDPIPLMMWSMYRHPIGRLIHFDGLEQVSINPGLLTRLRDREGAYWRAIKAAAVCAFCAASRELLPIHHHYLHTYRRLVCAAFGPSKKATVREGVQ